MISDVKGPASQRIRDMALASARENGCDGNTLYPAAFGAMVAHLRAMERKGMTPSEYVEWWDSTEVSE